MRGMLLLICCCASLLLVAQDTLLVSDANLEALVGKGDSFYRHRGVVEDGRPQGDWYFSFGNLRASNEVTIQDLRYSVSVVGWLREVVGTIENGKPVGTWRQVEKTILNSETDDPHYSGEISFEEGVPQRDFELRLAEALLAGRFKRNGLAHDVWSLYSDLELRENWHFRDGLLEYIVRIRDDGKDTLQILAPTILENSTIVNFDGDYLAFLDAWLGLRDYEGVVGSPEMRGLIIRNAELFRAVAETVRGLGATDFAPTFGVRVPTVDLTAASSRRLNEITDRAERIDTLADALLSNTSLTIAENTDSIVADLRTELRELSEVRLEPVRVLVAAYQSGTLSYLPLGPYLQKLFGSDDLAAVATETERLLEGTLRIEQLLNERLNTRERRQVVTALEEQLIVELGLLDSLIDARREALADGFDAEAIEAASREGLRAYQEVEGIVAKREAARTLVDCIEALEALTLTLSELPARGEEIDALYTDEVWNNFTATVMEQRLKKRIVEAYQERLLPFFQKRVNEELSCGNAAAINAEITSANARMLQLRQENTEALEDKLKSVKEPRVILQLFNENARKR